MKSIVLRYLRQTLRRFWWPALWRDLQKKQQLVEMSCREWAGDHTYLQELCRKAGLTEQEVEGDSYGVPCVSALAGMLSEALARCMGERDQLRAELAEVIHDETGENSCEVVHIRSRFSELHGQIDDLRAEVSKLRAGVHSTSSRRFDAFQRDSTCSREAEPSATNGRAAEPETPLPEVTDWRAVKRFYKHCRSPKQTAAHFDLSINTVKARVRREGW